MKQKLPTCELTYKIKKYCNKQNTILPNREQNNASLYKKNNEVFCLKIKDKKRFTSLEKKRLQTKHVDLKQRSENLTHCSSAQRQAPGKYHEKKHTS